MVALMVQWRETPNGERQYRGADGNWYSSEEFAEAAAPGPPGRAPVAPPPPAVVPQSRRKIGCGAVALAVIAVVIIVILVTTLTANGPSPSVKAKLVNVIPLSGNEVRLFIRWTNTGNGSGSGACVINTTVHNQFGDEVNIRVNSTNTNGNLKPGATQTLYQDIGVDTGDAPYVKASDVQITDC